MPAKVRKVKGGYRVSTPNAVHAKRTTKKKAESQARLLNAVDHGWKPDRKRKKANAIARRNMKRRGMG